MRIDTIDKLKNFAEVNQEVSDILNDMTRGRKSAADRILWITGEQVSEKLVRTYRENNKVEPVEIESAAKGMSYINSYYNPSAPMFPPITIPTYPAPMPSTGTTVFIKPFKEKPKTIVVMPDVQAPLHDVALVEKFIRFLGDYQPTELAQVGDFTDSTEISRWVRGKKPEFAGDLQAGFDTSMSILEEIRKVYSGRMRIVRSNHDDRLENYIQGCSPGAATLRSNTIEFQLGFDQYHVEFVRDAVVELAPGWVMAHGDEGSLSPSAGKTAFGLAKNKFGVSTVCGHTHRAGMTSESTGYNGISRNTLTGLEVGHFMDLSKADYLKKKGVAANWQQAFGILEVYGQRVYPRLITVQDGCFSVDGVEY